MSGRPDVPKPDAGHAGWRIAAPKNASQLACDKLRQLIIDGSLTESGRLLETQLAERLGVSRTPVREALARLASEGLVAPLAAGGYEVVDPMREFDDIFFIREVNEGLAARLAALRGTAEEIAEIVRLGEQSARVDLSDVESRARINTAFHTAIARASHAPRLIRLVEGYRELFLSPRVLHGYSVRASRAAIGEHRRIARAISERDGVGAEQLVREHLRRAYQQLLAK